MLLRQGLAVNVLYCRVPGAGGDHWRGKRGDVVERVADARGPIAYADRGDAQGGVARYMAYACVHAGAIVVELGRSWSARGAGHGGSGFPVPHLGVPLNHGIFLCVVQLCDKRLQPFLEWQQGVEPWLAGERIPSDPAQQQDGCCPWEKRSELAAHHDDCWPEKRRNIFQAVASGGGMTGWSRGIIMDIMATNRTVIYLPLPMEQPQPSPES